MLITKVIAVLVANTLELTLITESGIKIAPPIKVKSLIMMLKLIKEIAQIPPPEKSSRQIKFVIEKKSKGSEIAIVEIVPQIKDTIAKKSFGVVKGSSGTVISREFKPSVGKFGIVVVARPKFFVGRTKTASSLKLIAIVTK